MLSKAVNGFTAAEVDRVLQAKDMPLVTRVRAELLDLDNTLLFSLSGLQLDSEITHNVTQPMRRGANLRFLRTDRDSQHPAPLGTFAATITSLSTLFWLRMNESSGNFADSSGNSRTFTASGSPIYSVGSLVRGDQTNNAIGFSGNDFASIADAAWMDVSAIALMISYRGTTASGCLLDRDDGNTNRFFRLSIDSNGLVAFGLNFTSGSYTTFTAPIAITDGIEHLIYADYGGGYVRIYIDGKQVLKTAETRTLATGTLAINVGFTNAGTASIVGTLDEAMMLSRILSPREIRDTYQTWSGQTSEMLTDRDRGDRVKVYYGIRMHGEGTDGTDTAEWPQIVAVLTSPKTDYSETGSVISVACQDQTRILQDYTFSSVNTLASGGNYISGTGGVLTIAALAGFNTSAWAVTATTLTAPADIPFEIGTSALDAINYLLSAINYKNIRFSGDGTAIIEPNKLDKDLPVSDVINSTTTKVIDAENLSLELEPRKVPQRVIVGNGNPDASPIKGEGTINAGLVPISLGFPSSIVWVFQIDVPDQTTADNIAEQILADGVAANAKRIRYKTLPRPIHDDRDRYDVTIPEINILTPEGFVEEEWTLPLNGGMMTHSMLSVVDVT